MNESVTPATVHVIEAGRSPTEPARPGLAAAAAAAAGAGGGGGGGGSATTIITEVSSDLSSTPTCYSVLLVTN